MYIIIRNIKASLENFDSFLAHIGLSAMKEFDAYKLEHNSEPLKSAPAVVRLTGCKVCGCKLAEIRGRHPGEKKRMVCPCCLKEKLEDLHDMSAPNYDTACKAEAT